MRSWPGVRQGAQGQFLGGGQGVSLEGVTEQTHGIGDLAL